MARFESNRAQASTPGQQNESLVAPMNSASVAAGRIGRNSGIALASYALGAVFGLIALGILARGLGPIGLGRYYTVVVATMVVQLVAEAGIGTLLTHRLARGTSGYRTLLAEANGLLVLVVLASVTALFVLGAGYGYWRGQPALWVGVFSYAALACAAIQAEQFSIGVVRGFELFKYEAGGRVLQAAFQVVLLMAWSPQAPDDLPLAVAIWATSHVVAAAFLLVVVQWRWPCRSIRLDRAVLKGWLGESVPVGLGDILRRLTLQIDHLLLSIMAPAAMLGIYNVAIRPLGPLSLVPRTLVVTMFPYLSRTSGTDLPAFRRAFAAGTRLLWIVSLPASITVFVLSEPLVLFLAGPEFADAVLPMRVLAAVLLFSYPSTKFRFILTAIGRQRLFAAIVLTGLLFEAALEASLIPFFGYMGACTGFVIGEACFLVFGIIVCRRAGVGQVQWQRSVRAILPAIIMGITLWQCVDFPFFVQLAAAAVLSVGYLGLCAMSGAFRPEEIDWLLLSLPTRSRHRQEPTQRQTTRARSTFLVRLLRTLALAVLYFPYPAILRLIGPRMSVLAARLTATVHWLFTFCGGQRDARSMITAMQPQLKTEISPSRILHRYLVIKHQNFAERHTHATRRGKRFIKATYQSIEGQHYLDEAISEGRGVILLVFHFGAASMGFVALNARGYDAQPHMYRGTTYEGQVFDWMARAATRRLAATESKGGLRIIYHRPDMGFVMLLRRLRRGGIVGMNGDGMMATEFVEVPFLSTTLHLPTGPARLAAESGAPLVPLFTMPQGLWKHHMVLHPPLTVPRDCPGGVEEAIQHSARLLEGYVRRFPWMWWTWRRLGFEETPQGSQRLLVRSLAPGGMAHYESPAAV